MWKKLDEWVRGSYNANSSVDKSNSEFVKIKVEQKQTIEVDNNSYYKQEEINIVVKTHDPKTLPLQHIDTLDPERNPQLKEAQIKRDATSRIVHRGDDRNYETVKQHGGMLPKSDPNKWERKSEDKRYCPIDHRITSDGSDLVSTTSDQSVPHKFGRMFSLDADAESETPAQETKYSVYAVKVKGAMTPSPTVCPDQKEYSVPDGIPTRNIVAYRNCTTDGVHSKCSSIFFNQNFLKKYPELSEQVVNSQLFEGEKANYPKN